MARIRRHGAIEAHVHHEIHERVKKRNAERRKRFTEFVKRHREYFRTLADIIELHERFTESYRKHQSWLLVLREYFLELLHEYSKKHIDSLIDRAHRFIEGIKLLRDLVTGRARTLFVVEHRMFFARDKVVTQVRDKMLMDLPPDVRDRVIEGLIKASTAKYEPQDLIQQYPQLLWFLRRYVAYFKKHPCSHKTYALKLTPLTIGFGKAYRNTYYVLRFMKVDDMREDAFLTASRPIDLFFMASMRKPQEDVMNTMTYAGEGACDYKDKVTIARDDLRRDLVKIPLRRAVLQPHWIRRAFSKVIGKPEMYDVAHHCSIYAILSRRGKTAKLYEAGVSHRLIRKRPRRRIKEGAYWMGLRA